MEYIDFFKEFPLLPPQTLNSLVADGYIDVVEGPRVHVCIDVGLSDGIYCVAAIKSSPEVEQYLEEKSQELNTRFKQCTSALSFVKELQHSLSAMPVSGSKSAFSKYYTQIVKECDEAVGWDCVESFDKKGQTMTVLLKDESERIHHIYVNFAQDTFTSTIDTNQVPLSTSLLRYMEQQKKHCDQMSDTWDILDDLDATLCVLQPVHPKRSDLSRRIAISHMATALFEVSPERYYPKLVVYGPAGFVGPLNLKAKELKNTWITPSGGSGSDGGRSVRDNLELVLGVELPRKEEGFDGSDIMLECGICLSFEVEDEAADQVCTNDSCARPFHRQCLIQWLTTKEDTRQSYNTFFGKCPYCSRNIVVASS